MQARNNIQPYQVTDIHYIAKSIHSPIQIFKSGVRITSMATDIWKQAPKHADCFYKHLWKNGWLSGAQWIAAWYCDRMPSVQQCVEGFMEWVSMAEQLHPSHTSASAMQSVGCSGVKHAATGLWAVETRSLEWGIMLLHGAVWWTSLGLVVAWRTVLVWLYCAECKVWWVRVRVNLNPIEYL